jgi:membrane protease YdiL (CAAX protease family)
VHFPTIRLSPDTGTQPQTGAKGIVVFLLITFGAAWGGMFGARALGLSLVNPLVQLPFGFAPAVAAIVVRRWVTREGFGDAGLALRLKSLWRYYLAAWLGPPALVVVTAGLAAVTGVWQPSLAPMKAHVAGLPVWAFVLVLMVVLPLLAPVYWGEEFGWTSYLRLRLFPGSPALATAATGLIWATWHYPLAFLGYIEFRNVVIGLLVWTGSFLCQETMLSWLRVHSGSIWPVSLAHAGNNMVLSLLSGALLSTYANAGVTTSTLLSGAAVGVGCLPLALAGRRNAAGKA